MTMTQTDRATSANRKREHVRVAARRPRARGADIGRAVCESIESRFLLAAAIRAQIPASVSPSSIAQTLLGPGLNNFTLTSSSNGTAAVAKYRFSLNNAAAGQNATFSTKLNSGSTSSDAAIALFDSSGNQIKLQDADAVGGSPAAVVETMTAALQSGTVYTVEFFGLQTAASTSTTISYSIDTGPQKTGDTVTTNPATNTGSLTNSGAPNAFTSASDTRYFPIQFSNAGDTANVSIVGAAQDASVSATLFRYFGGAYLKQTSATLSPGGTAVTLAATEPDNQKITDGTYVLAVAPLNFSASPEPVTITSNATSTVSPATITPSSSIATLIPAVTSSTSLDAIYSGVNSSSPTILAVTATTTGPLKLTAVFNSGTSLAVYNSTGTTLLDSKYSSLEGSVLDSTIDAIAGATYYVRIGAFTSNFSLHANQTLAATTTVTVGGTLGQQAGLPLAAGAKVFTLSPVAGSRFLAVQLTPDSGSTIKPQVTILGSSGAAQTFTASAAGQPVMAIIDQTVTGGPYLVQATGLSGTGMASLKYLAPSLPATVSPAQFPQVAFNDVAGSAQSNLLTTVNGTPVGITYFHPANSPLVTTETFVSGATSGAAILLHYTLDGTTYRLSDVALPASNGTASVIAPQTRSATMHAIVALPINFSGGTGGVQLSVSGPKPVGSIIPLTPNTPPGDVAPAEGFRAKFNVTGKLANNLSRDLYTTTFPFTTQTLFPVIFTPTDAGGPLNVTISLLSSTNALISSITNTPGQPVSLGTAGLAAGQTYRIEVKPVAGSNIGSGNYTLAASVGTPDPRPFLIQPTDTAFYPYSSNQVAGRNYLPSVLPIPTVTFGAPAITRFFSSSAPYNPNGSGSIQVFKVNGFTSNVPFMVTTASIDGGVNTNFALYTFQDTNQDGTKDTYIRLAGTAPSYDYYPGGGDRSVVDARIVVNNTDLDASYFNGEIGAGSADIYVIMKNEYGSQGQFSIKAEPVPVNYTGPGATVTSINTIPILPASSSQYLPDQGAVIQTVNNTSFQVKTPTSMATTGNSIVTVKTRNGSSGQTISVSISTGIQFLGTYTGVVQSGGTATISVPLGRNATYSIAVSTTPALFPTSGFAVSLTVPHATAGVIPPATTTNTPPASGYSSSINRIDPAPDGSIPSALFAATDGSFRSTFSVETAGRVTLKTAYPAGATNIAVGIYQSGRFYSGSTPATPYSDIGVLLDYSNTAGSDGLYTVSLNLLPGTYTLVGQANIGGVTGFRIVTVTGNLPAVKARVLEVEPTTGLTTAAEEVVTNSGGIVTLPNSQANVDNFNNLHYRYTSAFFATTVPANATGAPISFTVYDTADNSGNAAVSDRSGTISLTVWKLVGGVYTLITSAINSVNTTTHSRTITAPASETAVPGATYFLGVDLNGYATAYYTGVTVPVATTGSGDLVVQPLSLTPNFGATLVQGSIINNSFNLSNATTYTLQLGGVTSTRTIPSLAPGGSVSFFTLWNPNAASDQVVVTANPNSTIPELSRSNNVRSLALSTVDAAAPAVTIALADANMTAEGTAAASTGGGTWGRYITGVTGQTSTIRVHGTDTDNNLFSIQAILPNTASGGFIVNGIQTFTTANGDSTLSVPFDFGNALATSASNPNQIRFYAVDQYGLRTPTYVQTLDVAAPPTFLTGGKPADGVSGAGGTVTFNRSTQKYQYDFQNSIISINKTLSGLLGIDLPVIGDKKNSFIVSVSGTGTGGLNPNVDIPLILTGRAAITALDKSVYDKSYTANQTYGNVKFQSALTLGGHTLVPGSASVSFQLSNLELLNLQTPLIPIAQIGVPGIASVQAGVKFGINAKLNAGVKLGVDPTQTSLGGILGSFGVMSPTFVQPQITGTASIVGSASLLGFDVAEVSGTVGLTLKVTLGLDNNVPGKIIPLGQAIGGTGLAVDATLNIKLAASVAFFGEIYSYNYTHDFTGIVNTFDEGTFLTDPPEFGSGKFIGPANSIAGRGVKKRGGSASSDDEPAPVIKNGNSLVGAYPIDPTPQIAIDNAVLNGTGISAQLVNAGTTAAPLANLSVATRTGGTWSGATTLSEANDISNPLLALTHDGGGTPGVVVYDADNVAGSPAGQTFNQRLTSQDIRYRYFNGAIFGAEQTLATDGLFDSQQSIAFNASGSGVLAYVKNTNATPMGSNGALDSSSNEIYASTWNSSTHSFGAPVAVTTGAGSDSQPTTFVDSSNKQYVVWIRTTSGNSQLMFSTNSGSGWSSPAVLPTSGLAAGATIRGVTMGSDGAGRINVIVATALTNADGTITSGLYQRPSLTSNFASNLPVVQMSANATYSGLHTTNTASGALVVYWQQSDGQLNQIFESTITNGSPSTPSQVSTSQDVAKRPSVAVDGDGKLQLLYDNATIYGGTSHGATGDPSVGAPTSGAVASSSAQMLPQFTFTSPLQFPQEQQQTGAIGSQLTGSATIANRGLAAGSVTITAYNGLPTGGTVVSTKTITLQPGATYDYSQLFNISAGVQNYSIKLTTGGGQAFNTTENTSIVQLTGLGDLSAISLTNDVSSPSPGTTQALYATVKNESSAASGSFTVTIYAGDPNSPQTAPTPISTQTVSNLAGNASTTLLFNVALPAGANDNVYTVMVDSAKAISESNENNNVARYEVDFRTDPALIASPTDGSPAVTATLLNGGTSNNVRIDAVVRNLGALDLTNVPVNLRVSRNGGGYIDLGQQTIASLAAGGSVSVSFVVTARAGDNLFTVSLDPSVTLRDLDLSNNAASASLFISGLPSLTASAALSSSVATAGAPLTLTAMLVNGGLADVANVPLIVTATPQGGGTPVVVGSGSINVDGLSTGSAAISLNTSSLAVGTYIFTLTVDPNGVLIQDVVQVNTATVIGVISSTLTLPAGNDYIRLNADGTHLDVWNDISPNGAPIQYLLSSLSSITTTAGSVFNLYVDFSNGSPIPSGGAAFNGGGAGSTLNVIGGGAADTFNFNSGNVNFVRGAVNGTVAYNNIGTIAITGGGGGAEDVINVNGAGSLPPSVRLDGNFTMNGVTSLNGTTLDLERSTVWLTYTPGNDPVTMVRSSLVRGYNNGNWNGAGNSTQGAINSSVAALGTNTGIGYADSADGRGVNTRPNSIELKYTLRADTNLDGQVDFNDLVTLAQNYNQTGVFDQADLNYDGVINFDDLVLLAQEYGAPLATLQAAIVAAETPKQLRRSFGSGKGLRAELGLDQFSVIDG